MKRQVWMTHTSHRESAALAAARRCQLPHESLQTPPSAFSKLVPRVFTGLLRETDADRSSAGTEDGRDVENRVLADRNDVRDPGSGLSTEFDDAGLNLCVQPDAPKYLFYRLALVFWRADVERYMDPWLGYGVQLPCAAGASAEARWAGPTSPMTSAICG